MPILEANEFFKDIPGFEGIYAITNLGRIWSYPKRWTCAGFQKSHNGKWIKCSDAKGPYVARLCLNGISHYYSVAKLVALTFIPNPKNLPVVAHKNEDMFGDRVENLYWTTKAEQIKRDIYQRKYRHGNKPKSVQASTGEVFSSIHEAAKWCGITHSVIMRHLNKKLVLGKFPYKTAGKHPKTKKPLKWTYYLMLVVD